MTNLVNYILIHLDIMMTTRPLLMIILVNTFRIMILTLILIQQMNYQSLT